MSIDKEADMFSTGEEVVIERDMPGCKYLASLVIKGHSRALSGFWSV